MRTLGYAFTTGDVSTIAKDLQTAGYEVKLDKTAGTIVAKVPNDGAINANLEVLRGFQHNKRWALRADPAAIKPKEG
jgi:hypothetical protein